MTLTELKARNPSWADMPDEKIVARAKERGVQIDPEPASAVPTNGNGSSIGSGAIPPAAAAGAQVLADRNAKPHVWDTFAKNWGLTGEDLKNYVKSAATGVAKAVTSDIPGLTAGNQLINAGVKYATGSTPAELVQSGAAAIGLPFHEARPGTADPYVETASRFMTMAPLGEGAIAPRLLSAAAGAIGSEGAGQLAQKYAPGLEGPARFLGGLGGGYAGGMAGVRGAGPRPPTPTTAQLEAQAHQKYQAAEASGVVLPADAYSKIVDHVAQTAAKKGIDPDLTKKSWTALDRLHTADDGTDKSVQAMDQLRQKIGAAGGAKNAQDARMAKIMKTEFDKAYEQVAPPELAQGRRLWSRVKGGETLDEIARQVPIKGSQYSQAGVENAYRERYRQLALNKRQLDKFTPEAQAAITNVAAPPTTQNFIRGLSKYAPTGVIPFLGNVAAGSGIGQLLGSPELGAIAGTGLAATGIGAKLASTALTKSNVRAAEAAVRGDPQAMAAYQARLRALQEQRMRMLQQSLARTAATSGLLQ